MKSSKNISFIVLEGILAAVVLNLYNPFTQIFAKRLGAGDLHIALINSLPQLVAIIVLIPCGLLIEKIRDKKTATCLVIIVNSIFYALIALVPFLPSGWRLNAYVLLIGLMNWPGSLYNTTWQSFFSYAFIGSEANRIYSMRSKYSALAGLVAALLTGLIISKASGAKGTAEVYQVIYACCFVIALLQALMLSKVKNVRAGTFADTETGFGDFNYSDFKKMLANKRFILYCLCSFVFHVSWHTGWPVFFFYHVNCVKANEFTLGLISVMVGLTSFIFYPFWNRFSEKRGSHLTLIIGAFGLATNPFLYIITTNIYIILLVNAFIGIVLAAFNLSLFYNLLEMLPESKKTVYISFFNTFIYISGFASPLMGIWLYHMKGTVGALILIGFLRIFAVAVLAVGVSIGKTVTGAKDGVVSV